MSPLLRYSIFVFSGVVTLLVVNRLFGDFSSLLMLGLTVVIVGGAIVDALTNKDK